MKRLVVLIGVGGVIGAVTLVLVRRSRASNGTSTPAPVSAPVHMAVGDSAPAVPLPVEADAAAP